MVNVKVNKKSRRTVLTQGQNRLLQDSLKMLLGPGLTYGQTAQTEKEARAMFLKDAVNTKVLEKEWLS